jgi:hypothetical protein
VKLHQAVAAGTNTFTGYGDDYVAVNGERREKNSIVLPDRILDWDVAGFDALRAEVSPFYPRRRHRPARHRRGSASASALTAALAHAGIGVG